VAAQVPTDTLTKMDEIIYEESNGEEVNRTFVKRRIVGSKTNNSLPNATVHFHAGDVLLTG